MNGVTDEERDLIAALAKAGKGVRAIARATGCSKITVQRWLHLLGLSRSRSAGMVAYHGERKSADFSRDLLVKAKVAVEKAFAERDEAKKDAALLRARVASLQAEVDRLNRERRVSPADIARRLAA